MARVHFVKKARKKTPVCKAAESYYWWANRAPGSRSGVKRYSKTPPKPSQTCGNPFASAVLGIQEQIQDAALADADELRAQRDSWVDEINQLAQEQRDKYDNMPEGLQQSQTGQLLEERADALENWAAELEAVDLDDAPAAGEQKLDEWIAEKLEELGNYDPGV